MSFMDKIRSVHAQKKANFNSVINVGDTVVIDWDGGLEVVRVVDMSVVLNNDNILPTEITIAFIFCTLNQQMQLTEYHIRITHTQFKYRKHLAYADDQGE